MRRPHSVRFFWRQDKHACHLTTSPTTPATMRHQAPHPQVVMQPTISGERGNHPDRVRFHYHNLESHPSAVAICVPAISEPALHSA